MHSNVTKIKFSIELIRYKSVRFSPILHLHKNKFENFVLQNSKHYSCVYVLRRTHRFLVKVPDYNFLVQFIGLSDGIIRKKNT